MSEVTRGSSSQAVRRRRRSEIRTIKKSFTLHEDVVQAAEVAVQEGEAENLSAFFEAAVQEKLRRSKLAALYGAYQAAAQDAVFMAEMRAMTRQFEAISADGLSDG